MFENATKLTADFLKNELEFKTEMTAKLEKVKFNEYYMISCDIIKNNFYLEPTPEQIETYITTGAYTHTDTLDNETIVTCPITDLATRTYLFQMAQAKQLIHDFDNGRGTINDDVYIYIKQLGLYQRTVTCK